MPRTLYPWAIERRYTEWIRTQLKPLVDYTQTYLKQHGEAMLRGDSILRAPERSDAGPGDGFHVLHKTLSGWVGQRMPEGQMPSEIMAGLGDTSDDVAKWATKEWGKATTQALGLDFGNALGDDWRQVRDRWADTNYRLIRSLSGDYIGRVNDLAERAIRSGTRYGDLAASISALGANVTGARARLIARDQIGKLNGHIQQAQQSQAGIEFYNWQTAGDERVRGEPGGKFADAIPSHAVMEGALCRWSDATVWSQDNGKTWTPRPGVAPLEHPGQPIQCRCVANPYLDNLVGDVDSDIDGKSEAEGEEKPEAEPAAVPAFRTFGQLGSWLAGATGWTLVYARPGGAMMPRAGAKLMAEVASRYAAEFPMMRRHLAYYGDLSAITAKYGGDAPAGAYAATLSVGGISSIGVNYSGWSMKRMTEELKQDGLEHFHPPGCDTIRSVVDHEYGHAIANAVGADKDPEIVRLWQSYALGGGALKGRDSAAAIREDLSGCAKKNIGEFIAEAWAEYRNRKHPRPLAKKIGDRLVELMKKKETR